MATVPETETVERGSPYLTAFLDWLACATAGADERAGCAVRASGDDLGTRVAFAGAAGHVHDFDDTLSDGVAHVSAVCAPAALVLAADLGLTLGDAVNAYAGGFEVMGALAAASHPALYERGWHPTSVCGPAGAATVAGRLLGLDEGERETALRLALLRTGGTQGAFGSDGKAIQVGLAAAAGVQAAFIARAGAKVSDRATLGETGFTGVFGAGWPGVGGGPPAIERNWIKLYPSCLGTHAPLEAALQTSRRGGWSSDEDVRMRVHPTAHRAAHLDVPADGLEAKFSIPYCVALAARGDAPRLSDFVEVDPEVLARARAVSVEVDSSLPEFGADLIVSGSLVAEIPAPIGAPECPPSLDQLADKVEALAGSRLQGVLDDLEVSAGSVLERSGLSS